MNRFVPRKEDASTKVTRTFLGQFPSAKYRPVTGEEPRGFPVAKGCFGVFAHVHQGVALSSMEQPRFTFVGDGSEHLVGQLRMPFLDAKQGQRQDRIGSPETLQGFDFAHLAGASF